MAGLDDLVQKAIYLGIGMADYAAEKAGATLTQLKTQAQKLADEMVARGEMSVEEARKYVDELVKQAERPNVEATKTSEQQGPRPIEIISEEEDTGSQAEVDNLKEKVEALKEELRRLKRE